MPSLPIDYVPAITDPSVITKSKCYGELAPGVYGVAFKTRKYIYIPLIIAVIEGSGHVGRFLNSLSPKCRIVDVMSDRLAGMLLRRGWKKISMRLPESVAELLWDEDEDFIEDTVDVWIRPE